MKKIEAIIRHFKVEEVKNALIDKNILGMTVSEARGFGRQRGQKGTFRGMDYTVDFLPKAKVEVVCQDDQWEMVVETIMAATKTGNVGDGKLFVSEIEDVIRIRTGESGTTAL